MAFVKSLQLLQALEQLVRAKRRQTTPCKNCDQVLLPCNPLITDSDASLDFRRRPNRESLPAAADRAVVLRTHVAPDIATRRNDANRYGSRRL